MLILNAQNCVSLLPNYIAMKHSLLSLFTAVVAFSSCGDYNSVLKSNDIDYRYEAAKQYFFQGKYEQSSTVLFEMLAATKGTERAEEALFLLGMSAFKGKDYESAASYFKKYYESYPSGRYVEEARLYAGRSLYANTPIPILDQTDTYKAITEFQSFVETYPNSKYRDEASQLVFDLQDKLIEKEYAAAKLYYDLGQYFGNCTKGGSNYQACIVTAQNAINDYPYSLRREDFAILILRSKFDLAEQSVEEKQKERYHSAIDEYHGFCNEYPESKFMPQAKSLYEKAKKFDTTRMGVQK